MKTLEVLNKYKIILSGILKCAVEDVSFYQGEQLIGEFDYDKDAISKHWTLGDYMVKAKIGKEQKVISTFKLYQLQHCCAFMVSCNALVKEEFRNKRIGTVLNSLRQDIGRLLGYSAILCTDIEQNQHQRQLLATQGWKDLHTLINKRTSNKVYLSVINI